MLRNLLFVSEFLLAPIDHRLSSLLPTCCIIAIFIGIYVSALHKQATQQKKTLFCNRGSQPGEMLSYTLRVFVFIKSRAQT